MTTKKKKLSNYPKPGNTLTFSFAFLSPRFLCCVESFLYFVCSYCYHNSRMEIKIRAGRFLSAYLYKNELKCYPVPSNLLKGMNHASLIHQHRNKQGGQGRKFIGWWYLLPSQKIHALLFRREKSICLVFKDEVYHPQARKIGYSTFFTLSIFWE